MLSFEKFRGDLTILGKRNDLTPHKIAKIAKKKELKSHQKNFLIMNLVLHLKKNKKNIIIF